VSSETNETNETTEGVATAALLAQGVRDVAGQVRMGRVPGDPADPFWASILEGAADALEVLDKQIADLRRDHATLQSAYRALGRTNELLKAKAAQAQPVARTVSAEDVEGATAMLWPTYITVEADIPRAAHRLGLALATLGITVDPTA